MAIGHGDVGAAGAAPSVERLQAALQYALRVVSRLMEDPAHRKDAALAGEFNHLSDELAASAGLRAADEGACAAALRDAVESWSVAFDGPEDEDVNVSGADLVDWFSEWRKTAKAALAAAPAAPSEGACAAALRPIVRYLRENGGDREYHDADGTGWLTRAESALAAAPSRWAPFGDAELARLIDSLRRAGNASGARVDGVENARERVKLKRELMAAVAARVTS